MKTFYYLREGSDYLENAKKYKSKRAAIDAFAETAKELAKYDQKHEASLHIAGEIEQISEYPDFVLRIGPRGGVVVERA